jgi:hypothetical protein
MTEDGGESEVSRSMDRPDAGVADIFDRLESAVGSDEFPEGVIKSAIEMREEIIPHLLKLIEDAAGEPERFIEEERFASLLFALYLLAQFRERRAYPLLVGLFGLSCNILDELVGDFVTEDLPAVLASVCGGDTGLIERLVENPGIDEYVRSSAARALLELVMAGVKSRDEVMAYFRQLFRGKLEREESLVWGSLVTDASSLHPAEVLEDIEKAFEDGLVDPMYVDMEYVRRSLAVGRKAVQENLRLACRGLVDDAMSEMKMWYDIWREEKADFHEDILIPHRFEEALSLADYSEADAVMPDRMKVGRNDPCPCGSGKKYKKCCMEKDKAQSQDRRRME